MGTPVVYVWKSEPRAGHFSAEAVSDASYGMLNRLNLPIRQRQVLIKPNVTIAATRESGIVTDCGHVEGIVRHLLDRGFAGKDVSIGEGGGNHMPDAFCVAGFTDVALAHGVALHSFNDRRLAYVDQDCPFIADRIEQLGRRQRIAQRVLDPDTFVINAPKLKTHNAMAITICIKNLMGTQYREDRGLCGISRQYADQKGMDYELRFTHEMCNLYRNAKPDFNVVDGAIARMGSGFQDGENYPLGLTVAGEDGFAVDFACSYFMGLNPEKLLLFKTARRQGLAPGHISQIDVRLVSPEGVEDLTLKGLERLSSPRGFWVKYHREGHDGRGRGKRGRLEEFCPGLYRRRVMSRHSDAGQGQG